MPSIKVLKITDKISHEPLCRILRPLENDSTNLCIPPGTTFKLEGDDETTYRVDDAIYRIVTIDQNNKTHSYFLQTVGNPLGDYNTVRKAKKFTVAFDSGSQAQLVTHGYVIVKYFNFNDDLHNVQKKAQAEKEISDLVFGHTRLIAIPQQQHLILEVPYIKGQSLDTILGKISFAKHKRGEREHPLYLRLAYLHSAARAVKQLHDYEIIHGDVTSENIIIKPLNLRSTLVAHSHSKDVNVQAPKIVEPSYHSPPEINKTGVTFATDIFQLGLVFFEVLTDTTIEAVNSQFTYSKTDGTSLHTELLDMSEWLNFKFPDAPNNIKDELNQLTQRMTNVDPENRPVINKIIKDLKGVQNKINVIQSAKSKECTQTMESDSEQQPTQKNSLFSSEKSKSDLLTNSLPTATFTFLQEPRKRRNTTTTQNSQSSTDTLVKRRRRRNMRRLTGELHRFHSKVTPLRSESAPPTSTLTDNFTQGLDEKIRPVETETGSTAHQSERPESEATIHSPQSNPASSPDTNKRSEETPAPKVKGCCNIL